MKRFLPLLMLAVCVPTFAQNSHWRQPSGPTSTSSVTATPNASPTGGAYSSTQTVTLTNSTVSASESSQPKPTQTSTGTTYYLSPTGKDSNSGLSTSSPWLTPNHAVNCGDTLIMAAGAYSGGHFNETFGVVSCPTGKNVAWLKCATAFACTISGGVGVQVANSYWGVQGLVVSTSTTNSPCFSATPNWSGGKEIHHIIFANNVASNCQTGGILVGTNGKTSADYVAVIGNVIYNGTPSSYNCGSGIDIFEPANSDTQAGTHLFIAGNISYENVNHDPCAGVAPTDGEGIILDTVNAFSYSGQIAVENNLLFANGGRGLQVLNSSSASIYFKGNTSYGNNTDSSEGSTICAEMVINRASDVQASDNLLATAGATACHNQTAYAFEINSGNATDSISDSLLYSAAGNSWNSSSYNGSGLVTGDSPNFAKPVKPAAPNCSGAANVPACMASVIADYTPANTTADSYGYRRPGATPNSDPLFPQWLCNVNLPSGLVTEGCAD